MARHGIDVFDESGKLVFTSDKLSHRVWYTGTHTSAGNIIYPEPLDHEPTVVALAISGGNPRSWTHITSGGLYTGLTLAGAYNVSPNTLIIVFARR